jgi:ubiquitin-like modifier-activating enzyme ATG7
MASALAVELMVALLHHPQRQHAPVVSEEGHPEMKGFGTLPHQMRGFLNRFTITPMHGQAFAQCIGCSPAVVAAFRERGLGFLLEALAQPQLLEQVSGLAALKAETEKRMHDDLDNAWDIDEEEEHFGPSADAGSGSRAGASSAATAADTATDDADDF